MKNPNKDMYGISRITEIKFSSGVDAYKLAQEISKNPDVEYAEPMYERKLCETVPNDPRYTLQWAPKVIGLEKAWDITQGSSDVVIAIVDGGVFMNHEDLQANIWTNPKEIPDNGIDDDGNGFIDDVHGWDFVGNYTGGAFYPDNDPQPTSTAIQHGTHVAGCAAAVGNNGIGIAGSAWNCKILPVKVGSDNPNMSGIYNGYQGIQYAAEMGADIINCSWGGPGYSQAEQDIINHVTTELGSIVIVAAGNDGHNMAYYGQYPAQLDNIISIGSSDQSDGVSSFSNFGAANCVYAPGSGIQSTIPGNSYTNMDGTSMASPVLAGVAALVKSLHPTWKFKEMYHQLRSTSDDIFSGGNENKRLLYYGRVNAFKAVSYNSPNSTNTIPGISLKDYTIGNNKDINKYGTFNSSFTFRNYLAKADLVTITMTPTDDFISLTQSTFTIVNFDSTKNQTLNIDLTLKQSNPWFDGPAKILVKYESNNYVDYQVIEIPIKIKSPNRTATLAYIPSYFYANWYGSHSPTKNVFWVVGYSPTFQRGLYFGIGSTSNFNYTQYNEQLTSVYAFDFLNAYFGSTQTNMCEVLKTADAANSFSRVNVTTITPFINEIYFFNSNYGIILGDQISNKFGVGYTSDAGATWKKIPQQPVAQAGENGFVGSYYFYKDNVWFGTSRGRVLHSTDKGQAWTDGTIETGKPIQKIAFQNENNGLALYGNENETPTQLAATNDGGKTWQKDVMDFATLSQLPVDLFSAEDAQDIFVATHEGRIYRTPDLGKTWTPILSSIAQPIKLADVNCSEESGRLWMVNDYISYTDFIYGAPNPQLTNLSGSNIVFKKTEVSKANLADFKLQNTGNTIIEIDTVYIENTPDNEFSIISNIAKELDLNQGGTIKLRFSPLSAGVKTGNLIIKSDAQNYTIPISGEAYSPGSVKELENMGFRVVSLSPNPADGQVNLSYNTNNAVNLGIDLYDLHGLLVSNIYKGITSIGPNNLKIKTADLATGTYYLNISIDGTTAVMKFVVKR